MSSLLREISFNPSQLALSQQLAQYSFEIPQNPQKIRSCYDKSAIITTNGEVQTLDLFIASMIKSNTENVTKIYSLRNSYEPSSDKQGVVWTVNVQQKRYGKGSKESDEGIYKIVQIATLTFGNGKILTQVNVLKKTKVTE